MAQEDSFVFFTEAERMQLLTEGKLGKIQRCLWWKYVMTTDVEKLHQAIIKVVFPEVQPAPEPPPPSEEENEALVALELLWIHQEADGEAEAKLLLVPQQTEAMITLLGPDMVRQLNDTMPPFMSMLEVLLAQLQNMEAKPTQQCIFIESGLYQCMDTVIGALRRRAFRGAECERQQISTQLQELWDKAENLHGWAEEVPLPREVSEGYCFNYDDVAWLVRAAKAEFDALEIQDDDVVPAKRARVSQEAI